MILTLFYPEVGQNFVIEDGESVSIIRGPFPITDNQKSQLAALGEEVISAQNRSKLPSPTPTPTISPIQTKTSKAPFRSPPQPTQAVATLAPPEIISSEEAEITPRGDVVHYITKPTENINDIAAWYTDDKENGEKLLRLNNITNLEIGDTVVIPSYLVKKKIRMP